MHPYGKGALKTIASFDNPKIKVIFLTRNPLDRYISNKRHEGYQHSQDVPAHCAIDDEECVQRHRAHSKELVFKHRKQMVRDIKHAKNIDELAKDLLSMSGVDFLSVTYENLYSVDDVGEWIRIFDFLGRSPKDVENYKENLTRKDVEKAFAIAPTSTNEHNETITNFEDVKQAFFEGGYGYLLH